MTAGLTFDAGALIGLERRRTRIANAFKMAVASGRIVTVPAIVVAEWWRGRTDARDRILCGVRIEPMDDALAKAAGRALASVRSSTTIDAVVMASAARRGDTVYTSDVDDLERLTAYFPEVRVLAV
jgi:predicted nucleic acid-binding protein